MDIIKAWIKQSLSTNRRSGLVLNSDATLSVNVATLRQSKVFKDQLLAGRKISDAQGQHKKTLKARSAEPDPVESD